MDQKSESPSNATVMAHFYRGELGRMTAWRNRFDITTHWAIITITGIITFAWTNDSSSNFLFMLSNVMIYLLLTIEARRYRFYDAYRARVRILESHFIFPVVTGNPKRVESTWQRLLGTDLIMPSFKISFWEALSRRFNRNYIWLFLITFVAWMVLIFTHNPEIGSLRDFLNAFSKDQPVPLIILLPLIGGFYLYLICLGLLGLKTRKASGEFQKRPNSGSREWSL